MSEDCGVVSDWEELVGAIAGALGVVGRKGNYSTEVKRQRLAL